MRRIVCFAEHYRSEVLECMSLIRRTSFRGLKFCGAFKHRCSLFTHDMCSIITFNFRTRDMKKFPNQSFKSRRQKTHISVLGIRCAFPSERFSASTSRHGTLLGMTMKRQWNRTKSVRNYLRIELNEKLKFS